MIFTRSFSSSEAGVCLVSYFRGNGLEVRGRMIPGVDS